MRVTRQVYRFDDQPIEEGCDCPTCARYSRGYLNHLMKGKHTIGSRFLSVHNLRHYQLLMGRIRASILAGTFDSLYRELKTVLDG